MQTQETNTRWETSNQSSEKSKLASVKARMHGRTAKTADHKSNCNDSKTSEYFDIVGVAG